MAINYPRTMILIFQIMEIVSIFPPLPREETTTYLSIEVDCLQ